LVFETQALAFIGPSELSCGDSELSCAIYFDGGGGRPVLFKEWPARFRSASGTTAVAVDLMKPLGRRGDMRTRRSGPRAEGC
jgi:hypothetical protein